MTNRKSPTSFPMSLRWTAYVAPNPQRGPQKRHFFRFPYRKLDFPRRKSATKFLCVKTFSGKVVMHSLAYLSVHKWLVADVPLYLKFWGSKWPTPFYNGAFQSIFARSSTSVTASENSSIITNRKSTTRFPMSLWSTSYPASKPPKGGQKRKVTVLWRFWLGISKKVWYRVALCENCQRQSCKAFTGLSIRAQMFDGGHPLKYKFCSWREPPVSAASLHPVAL